MRIIVLWLLRKNNRRYGNVFAAYLVLSGLERLLIEQIRINPDYHFLGVGITQAEGISLLLMMFGAAGVLYTRRSSPEDP